MEGRLALTHRTFDSVGLRSGKAAAENGGLWDSRGFALQRLFRRLAAPARRPRWSLRWSSLQLSCWCSKIEV